MKRLTKAEEQIMQILWDLEKGFVRDIIEHLPHPKPAYNTVSTIVRILEKKGFVSHDAYGNTHEYYPVITKEDYTKAFLKSIMKDYFSDSFKEMVSFFARDKDMNIEELEEIRKMISQEIHKQKRDENE
ncbi:MAG: BlaI/MecI/CopY family transcriptional regulator [Candidatus Aminicenantes bacterium]|jgi:BlaI family penicillinase repressor|nr:BlaI/MecI/CopY family transcriptional regulator [Candidatus Aminicenantes bacterium]MDH5383260.1 BlaI/MecI/CopY family transcriptional regulator [Candidatus Aminicenantes bacterium]MDH5745037.1 BlaI/MecI/CopY family transcriptional regulator [Candidatus Aminicenantes bacterium]